MKPIRILLVEDNPGDVILTREALEDGRLLNELADVSDGEAALRYLKKQSPYEHVETPDLVLLDINLPKVSGLDVLRVLKDDEELKKIPVLMLTTSSAEGDILLSYESYANAYLTKPVDYNDFVKMIQSMGDFWLNLVRLPSKK